MKKFLKTSLGFFLSVVILSFFVNRFIVEYIGFPATVKGASMEPGYHNEDRIFVNRVELIFRKPVKGDVVIVKNLKLGGYDIKRISAIPGDEISDITSGKHYKLSKDQYFILGDNSKISLDSRNYGPINLNQIIGIVK